MLENNYLNRDQGNACTEISAEKKKGVQISSS